MYRLSPRHGSQGSFTLAARFLFRSVTQLSKLVAVAEKRNCLQIVTNDVTIASTSQIRTATATATAIRVEPTPLLDSSIPEVSPEVFEVSKPKIVQKIAVEKSALPFEEIPGPAVLKLWEKYWKFVPLLGTQLLSGLLINSFTHGRLTWNRNITPLKYLFDAYGPVVRINGPMIGDVVLIHRPEHVAEVLSQEGEIPIRSGIDVLQHYRLRHRKCRLPGPFSMQGSEWLETKANMEKPLAQQISRYFVRLDTICDEFAERVRRIRNRQDEVSVEFDGELSRWGMESFSVVMFNRRLGFLDPLGSYPAAEPTRIIDALADAHVYLSKCETGFQVWRFLETPYSRKLFAACDVIDGFIAKHIRREQSRMKSGSLANSQDNEESSPILERLLMDQKIHPDDVSALLMDMIILGVQATANTQAFLLYFLAKNPRIQRKIREEIASVVPEAGRSLTEDSLARMTYLKACLRECLRLRPAFPYLSRMLPRTIALRGYTIPKGTYIIMANQISSRREENFEDPGKFQPDRWLDERHDDYPYQKFSCLPFGHGVRSCMGKIVAETEILLLTAKLVREFKIEYDYGEIESKHLIVNVPNKPLRFRFVDAD